METAKILFEELPQAVSLLTAKMENLESLLRESLKNQSSENPDQLLTVEQAADFLSLAVPTVYTGAAQNERRD